MRRFLVLMTAALLVAGPAVAQEVSRAAVPAWVRVLPTEAAPAASSDAPIRVLSVDQQIRFDAEGQHSYSATRVLIQTTQGLSFASTINASWMPPRQTVEVHAVRIIRNGQVIDVLENQTFQTLRRERNLESSMLDGMLTATLQPRDLRVGDILETVFTVHDNGGVLGAHREALESAAKGQQIDRYRLRASWPADMTIRARASEPWTSIQPRRTRDGYEFEIDQRDLPPLRLPGDLPVRFQLVRVLELTDFSDWSDASILMAPLYERAATLEADSPLLAEIERIRQAHPTPAGQVAAALRLVQDDVRYLALSMGEGGYVPTSADETWRSRYGDCKAKTVLLLALFKGLGIEAEAAMVSTGLGDGLDTRLPMVGWFDHVLVRVVVDGKIYWIDGARTGDRALETIIPPGYHWALPIRAEGAGLEAIEVPPLEAPTVSTTLRFDASQGLDAKASVTGELIFSGDAATVFRAQMAQVPADRMQEMLRSLWSGPARAIEVTTADSGYDDATNTYRFTMSGEARLAWTNNSGGRALAVPESTVGVEAAAERTDVAYRDSPYAIQHPVFAQSTVTITLPRGGEGFRLEGGDVDAVSGGYRLQRNTSLEGGVVTLTASTRSLTGEVSAADMAQARTRTDTPGGSPVRVRAPSGYRPTDADRARTDTSTTDVQDLLDRARDLTATDDLQGALTLLDRAVELEPDNVNARVARGDVYLALSRYPEGRADFDHAVDQDPADLQAVVGQGRAAYADGKFNEAVVSFSVALRLEPTDEASLSARGASYYQLGRYDRALADFRALQTAGGPTPTTRYGELRALLRLNRNDEAREVIDTMLTEAPTDPVALTLLVRLAANTNRPADALPMLDRAVEASPENIGLRTLRAEARIRAGADADARADLQVLRETAHGDPLLINNLCWTEGVMGFDLEQALADCDAALAGLGESAAIIDSRAMVLLHLGRYEEARAGYDVALAAEPEQLASLYGRGLARLALGDEGGREDIARARARDIDSGEDFAVFEARHPELRP